MSHTPHHTNTNRETYKQAYVQTYVDIGTHAYLYTYPHTPMLTLTVCPTPYSLFCFIIRKRPHQLSLMHGVRSSLMASGSKAVARE